MQLQSLWSAVTPELDSFANRPLPERADVVVIGGGYTGLSAALRLAKLGARVTLLERETLGWGASSRNGGMVLTGHKHGVGEMMQEFGATKAHELWDASLAALECVATLVQEENIECDFARRGHLDLAWKEKHIKHLQSAHELLYHEFDYPTLLVPKTELRNEIDTQMYYGGLVDERSAGLNPAKYVRGMARAAQRAGADLHDGVAAEAIEKTANGFNVKTARGAIAAKDVFAATNGYTGRATPQFQKRIIPIGSFIIATEPLDPKLAQQLIPHNRMIFDTKNFLYYFRRSPDDRIVFGGRAAFFPETPDTVRESAEILRKGMLQIFPQVEKYPTAYAWGGTLGFTFDIFPHAGQMDGMYYAMGYAGHGVALSTYLGRQFANRIAGQEWHNPFEGMDFPTMPWYSGNPWFLPFAMSYYRFMDWVA
ncbi:MAG: FAD-binding oxidoreductase [Chloroflexi bacterium]|nr:FAD-binding oxidoreductase [Chloroflexota bacterium]